MFGILTLALALLGQPDPPSASAPSATSHTITVRVYQQGGYHNDLLPRLRQAVARVVEGSSLDIALVDCQPERSCERRGAQDVVLLLAHGRQTTPGVCGEAVPGEARQRGTLMIVYGGCVTAATARLRDAAFMGRVAPNLRFLTEADVFGPVIVHELIHLLLPGTPHGEGLMQAVLGQAEWDGDLGTGPRIGAGTALQLAAVIRARTGLAVDGAEP